MVKERETVIGIEGCVFVHRVLFRDHWAAISILFPENHIDAGRGRHV